MFASELSDARISYAKHAFLAVMCDDFFDGVGSLTEQKQLIWLVEKWDVNMSTDCCSEKVRILFAALRNAILETAHKASISQGRDVTTHIIDIWLDLLYADLRESEWNKAKSIPSLEEHLSTASVTFALGPIIIPVMYIVGPKFSEAVVRHPQFRSLFNLLSMVGRLMNDIQGLERELQEGKMNSISLRMIHYGMSEAEAIAEVKGMITSTWRQVLRLVAVETEGDVVPKACKDVFWDMCKVVQLFYTIDDGYTSSRLKQHVKSIIYEPISVSPPATASVKNL